MFTYIHEGKNVVNTSAGNSRVWPKSGSTIPDRNVVLMRPANVFHLVVPLNMTFLPISYSSDFHNNEMISKYQLINLMKPETDGRD